MSVFAFDPGTEEIMCEAFLCDLGTGKFMVRMPFLQHGHLDHVDASTIEEAKEAACGILRIRVPILLGRGEKLPVSELPPETPEEFTRVELIVQL